MTIHRYRVMIICPPVDGHLKGLWWITSSFYVFLRMHMAWKGYSVITTEALEPLIKLEWVMSGTLTLVIISLAQQSIWACLFYPPFILLLITICPNSTTSPSMLWDAFPASILLLSLSIFSGHVSIPSPANWTFLIYVSTCP